MLLGYETVTQPLPDRSYADEWPVSDQASAQARTRAATTPATIRAARRSPDVSGSRGGVLPELTVGDSFAWRRSDHNICMDARAQVLITAAELADRLRASEPVTILDVRWRLDQPDGRATYLQGHLPGAVYVSLEDELSDHSITRRGRHPLPSGRNLEASARRWGIREGVPTVVYDDWNRAGSARAWWVLTAAGLTDVRILDGGLSAWRSVGGSVVTGPVTSSAGNATVLHDDLYAGALPTLTAQQATFDVADVTLLDARAPERFRGDVEPVDPVAGHIPGAKNLPSADVLASDGTFLANGALRRRLSDHGIALDGRLGAYCGSGVSATVILAALTSTGLAAALFPGSWSEWSSDPARPVARGFE
jgi:thiosulfate/3-mercaptopyruvate sulfurtransferase